MPWTTPMTWQTDEIVSASMLNEQIRDNLAALKAPPTASHVFDEASNYTTTSTVFVDVDATNLALTVFTNGGDVLVHFHGSVARYGGSVPGFVYFDVDVDGARTAGNDGIIATTGQTGNYPMAITFSRLISGLSAGQHVFKLQWKVDGSTPAILYAGAGTTLRDLHPQFWVREVS